MENNNLATHKLANLYCIINADDTSNKMGQITKYIQAYVEIGSHKTTQHFFITNLGNKEMMIATHTCISIIQILIGKKINGSLPGAWIYILIKSVKHKM